MSAARAALSRFVYDLLGRDDEMFLYRFDSQPELVQGWTENRATLMLASMASGREAAPAMYDTVAEAVPMAATGSRTKKALVIISDGNDTNSSTRLADVLQVIRESEVLVYAIGIDGAGGAPSSQRVQVPQIQFPFPRRPTIGLPFPRRAPPPSQPPSGSSRGVSTDDVNAAALQSMTDDSGGRTEIVSSAGGSRPRDRRHRRRTQPPVRARVRLEPAQRRTVAHHRGAGEARESDRARAAWVYRRLSARLARARLFRTTRRCPTYSTVTLLARLRG